VSTSTNNIIDIGKLGEIFIFIFDKRRYFQKILEVSKRVGIDPTQLGSHNDIRANKKYQFGLIQIL
jgi:hypothetical protein